MKAYAQYTITTLCDGEGSLSVSIRSSGAALRHNEAVDSVLTAEVRRGERLLGAEELQALGTLSWFRDGNPLPVAEGQTLSVQTQDAATAQVRLERFGETLRGNTLCFSDPVGGRALRRLLLVPGSSAAPSVLKRCGKNLVENLRTGSSYSASCLDAAFDAGGRCTLRHKDNSLTTIQVVPLNPTVNYSNSGENTAALYARSDLFVLKAGHSYLVRDCTLGGFTGDESTRVTVNGNALNPASHRTMSYTPAQDLHVKQVRLFFNPQTAYDGSFLYEPMVCEGTDASYEPYCGESWPIDFPEGAESCSPNGLAVLSLPGINTVWTDAGELSFVWESETLAWAELALSAVYDGSPGRTSYLHVKYSNDGESFTAMGGEVLGTWIGTLVDFNEQASTVFSDYSWKRFSDDTELRREVTDYTDRQIDSLQSLYLAKSDFGSFSERINTQIEQTARGVVESYGYESLLAGVAGRADEAERFLTEMNGQIRRGVIEDPETGELHFGIAISEKLLFTGETQEQGGRTYYRLAPGQTLGLYTSLGWQFWINGVKCGWFSSADSMLHVSNSIIENTLRLGADWAISAQGGFGLRYTGG